MALMFNWKNIKERDHGLTFDDVLIIPRKSEVKSRRDPSLRSKITKTKEYAIRYMSEQLKKSPEEIAKECGTSVETIYVYLAKFGLRKSKR